jgi:DNA-binding NarL/FixJ family response regulator
MPPDRTDDGARAARQLRETNPELGIVLLSQHLETRHSVELVTRGKFGYLPRPPCRPASSCSSGT